MSIEDTIFNALAEGMSTERKQGLVRQLADKLGVDVHIGPLPKAVPVQHGDRVMTSQGEARAVVIDEAGRRALRQVLEAV